jgi:ribosomal protein S18 acetylase RimI-like enzyme
MRKIDSVTDLEPQLANARDYWLGWGDAFRQDGDLVIFRSGVAHQVFNGVFRLTGTQPTSDALEEASRRLDGVPWMWHVGPDSREGLVDDLVSLGATLGGTSPIMSVDLDRVIEQDGPPELKIEEVDTPEALGEWVEAYVPLFGVTPDQNDTVKQVEANYAGAPGSLVRFAGRIDGRVAGTAALFDKHGVAGVYVVATGSGDRRRGIGTRLTAAALRAGQERGLRVGTLQASSTGALVYRRMGFEKVAEYQLLAPPKR